MSSNAKIPNILNGFGNLTISAPLSGPKPSNLGFPESAEILAYLWVK